MIELTELTPIEEIESRIINFVILDEIIEVEMEDGRVIQIKIDELKDVDISKGKLAEILYNTNRA